MANKSVLDDINKALEDAATMGGGALAGALVGRGVAKRVGRKGYKSAREELDNANQINSEADRYDWNGRAIDPHIDGNEMNRIRRAFGSASDALASRTMIGTLAGGAAGAATAGAINNKRRK